MLFARLFHRQIITEEKKKKLFELFNKYPDNVNMPGDIIPTDTRLYGSWLLDKRCYFCGKPIIYYFIQVRNSYGKFEWTIKLYAVCDNNHGHIASGYGDSDGFLGYRMVYCDLNDKSAD